jgi:hypothetical protein
MTGEIANVKFITFNFFFVGLLSIIEYTGWWTSSTLPCYAHRHNSIGCTYGLNISIKRYTLLLCYYAVENARIFLQSGATVWFFSVRQPW